MVRIHLLIYRLLTGVHILLWSSLQRLRYVYRGLYMIGASCNRYIFHRTWISRDRIRYVYDGPSTTLDTIWGNHVLLFFFFVLFSFCYGCVHPIYAGRSVVNSCSMYKIEYLTPFSIKKYLTPYTYMYAFQQPRWIYPKSPEVREPSLSLPCLSDIIWSAVPA
jgi:hypothetical protein